MRSMLIVSLFVFVLGCGTSGQHRWQPARWSIALHGGAGAIAKDAPQELQLAYQEALERALTLGADVLRTGGTSLDAVEQVIRVFEDDPMFNCGRGAVFNNEGKHELDASIMDGETLACGAVTGVVTVKHPISLARKVMTDTRHVLFSGVGAEHFADQTSLERVENSYFSTELRRQQWLERRARSSLVPAQDRGTVGVVALDSAGHLAAGTSTGGLTLKRWGRVGDSPIIGAGTYADDRTCAVSCTGTGEEFIRHAIAYSVSARMALARKTVQEASDHAIHEVLQPDDGGLVALDRYGHAAFSFSTAGMYRGAADSKGRFEVGIHETMIGASLAAGP